MTSISGIHGAGVVVGSLAAAMLSVNASPAAAQQTSNEAQPEAPPRNTVVVTGEREQGYTVDEPSLPRLTEPLIDTPQMVSTVTRQVMDDRANTSLSDVFRNSSGISLGAGESSWQGTNLTLRGFNARNDIFLDGMRDFGSYYRDPFDLEQVEVLQGPSSILFGRGSTGGVVNQVSKTPTLAPHYRGEVVLGTDDTRRVTADLDAPLPELGEGAAVRLAAVGHSSSVAGRDEARYRRYGLAPSLAVGLGTPTRLTLSYLHQEEDDRPDYGLPWYRGAPAVVARQNFYGFDSDYLKTQVDIGTVRLEHDFGSDLTLRDQLRYANYARQWRDTEPQVATAAAGTPLSSLTVNRVLQGGRSRETFLQNQMDLLAHVDTGGIHHDLVAGWEIGPESSKPTYNNGTGLPPAPLLSPDSNTPFAGTIYPRIAVSTTAFSVAAYVIDTIKLGTHWEVAGGVRWDHFQSDYEAQYYSVPPATLGVPTNHVSVHQTDEAPSFRGSLVYKPVPFGSIYFDFSTSFNPSAEALSQIVAVRSLTTGNIGLDPEKNRTFELGTKWVLFDGRFTAQAAIFRQEKQNARIPDPSRPGFNTLGGDQRVDGGEIELAGQITPGWNVTASYTHLDGKVVGTGPGGPPIGTPIFNAPKDSVAGWMTYQLPYGIKVGGGLNYMSSRYAEVTAPVAIAPGYIEGDLMASWQASAHIRVQVNVANISDAYYFDQLHGYHVIPGPARSALFTLAFTG